MKRKIFLILSLLTLALSACLPGEPAAAPVAAMPTLASPVGETAVAPPPATATLTTTLPAPAATATPTGEAPAAPDSGAPVLITRDNTNVRLGPGLTYGVSRVLPAGSTAPIIGKNLNGTWWAVPGPGGSGPPEWISAAVVSVQGNLNGLPFLSAPTLTPTPALPDVPLVENGGAPPSNLCLTSRPGQFPPPDIHLGPGRQFALMARLGNWAEILKTEAGWHQILVGPNQAGWIHSQDVEMIGSCPTPAPQRIEFEPGAISAIVDGALQAPQRDRYLFRAEAGQFTIIEISSTEGRANFMLSGVEDGQPYKRLEVNVRRLWVNVIPHATLSHDA